MNKKTFNRLLDTLRDHPEDMGVGIHSELVMNAYADTMTGHKEYLWWNLCFDEQDKPIYSCPIDPKAIIRPSPGVCMGSLAVFHDSEDLEIKRKIRERQWARMNAALSPAISDPRPVMTGDHEMDRRTSFQEVLSYCQPGDPKAVRRIKFHKH